MHSIRALDVVEAIGPVLYGGLIVLLGLRRQLTQQRALVLFVGVKLLISVLYSVLDSAIRHRLVSRAGGYTFYLHAYWTCFVLETLLGLAIVYEMYQQAMAPLPGLQHLGKLVFRWAGAIAACLALGLSTGPHAGNQDFFIKTVMELQRTQSILTLGLLLFVTFAIQPLGLTFRSRTFGVSLGLGMVVTSEMVQSAWTSQGTQISALANSIVTITTVISTSLWIAYFALPEQKRQMIILPTTSPFLRWNQIAQALGDSPGFVAVGGVDPSFFAPAEVEIMERASLKMKAMDDAGARIFDLESHSIASAS